MDTATILSCTASLFSVLLAVFAIWLSYKQRQESQDNYVQTKDVLSRIDKVMEKTELLVSENFQKLLTIVTDQQGKMLESLKPRPSSEDKLLDIIRELALDKDPQKLQTFVDTYAKLQKQPSAGDGLTALMGMAMEAKKLETLKR